MKQIRKYGIILAFLLILPFRTSAEEVLDTDQDGVSDKLEIEIYRTDPFRIDTDGDGHIDGKEIENGYSPTRGDKLKLRQSDSDGDGLWDDWEFALGTDFLNKDSDGDGFSDGQEVQRGYTPLSSKQEKLAKRIAVNLKTQRLAYYFGETKLDEFAISSGLANTPTPVGEFSVLRKRPFVNYGGPGYSYPNTKWNLMFKPGNGLNYYIHGAYWHNDFGRPKSHGCVNVKHSQEYMGRLYDWVDLATPVTIVKS